MTSCFYHVSIQHCQFALIDFYVPRSSGHKTMLFQDFMSVYALELHNDLVKLQYSML